MNPSDQRDLWIEDESYAHSTPLAAIEHEIPRHGAFALVTLDWGQSEFCQPAVDRGRIACHGADTGRTS
jgi:hypothetical protein